MTYLIDIYVRAMLRGIMPDAEFYIKLSIFDTYSYKLSVKVSVLFQFLSASLYFSKRGAY